MTGFNLISRVEAVNFAPVNEILCNIPKVRIEKSRLNAWDQPKRLLRSVSYRLYASVRPNCKLTNQMSYKWSAYYITDLSSSSLPQSGNAGTNDIQYSPLKFEERKFDEKHLRYSPVTGLKFTNTSEDISIPATFFNVGLHLICCNVAMTGVRGMNASDCMYANIVLSPLVAKFSFGVKRRVGAGKVIEMDAGSDSYDPDVQLLAESTGEAESNPVKSNFSFAWSFPIKIGGGGKTLSTDSQQADMIFGATNRSNAD